MSSIGSLTATDITRSRIEGGVVRYAVAAAIGLALGSSVLAADASSGARATESEPMKMDEPMSGEMKKKGMKKGDVRKAAEKKEAEMRDMIEKEEESMPRGPVKK
jgi:hypothetical protein